ncbi:MAG: hypothetical protein PVJ43_06310, partial [Gemmatimonadales bacterium]
MRVLFHIRGAGATALVAVLTLTGITLPRGALAQEREVYLSLAERAFEAGLTSVPAQVERWKATWEPEAEWGYAPPGGPVYFARLAGSLYRLTGDERYAREAISWLARQHEYKEYFPEEMHGARPDYRDGVPTMTNFFELSAFGEAFISVKDSPALTSAQ